MLIRTNLTSAKRSLNRDGDIPPGGKRLNGLRELLSDPSLTGSIPRHEIPEALASLEALKAKLLCRLIETSRDAAIPLEPRDGLITVDEAAERLSFTAQYLYELIRKSQFPAVHQGKYIRIRISDLSQWIDQHRAKPFDSQIYSLYSDIHGRKRTAGNKEVTRHHPRTNGRENRRVRKHNSAMGAERVEDIRAHFTADSSATADGNRVSIETKEEG